MRGSDLVPVAAIWPLVSILVLCVVLRLLYSFRRRTRHSIPVTDDLLVVSVGVIALASMLSMSAIVTDAATLDNAPYSSKDSKAQLISYVSTILSILDQNLAKLPLVLWLVRLKLFGVYRMCRGAIGCAVFASLLAMTTVIIFQCKLPEPWDIESGQCISSRSLWIALIAIDIFIDASLFVFPTIAVMSLGVHQHKESRAAFTFSLRTVLIVLSLIRLVYLQQQPPDDRDFVLRTRPYTIATQCQITIAVMLSCTPAMPFLAYLIEHPPTDPALTLKKHCSGSSFGSDIANEYFASVSESAIKAPLPALPTAVKATVHSRHGIASSLSSSIENDRLPIRPPPPSEHERPDMEAFIHRPTVLRPPPVTLLYDGYTTQSPNRTFMGSTSKLGDKETFKHVRFEV